ncbi:MAG: ribulose-phosphate 3-epimerase [Solitalea-like symbiont of Acarus siro]
MKVPIISPSILNADFLNLYKEIAMLNESQADYIHLDVMDGVFVDNISFGMPVLASIKHIAKKDLDLHLMIVNPEKYLETFARLGVSLITVHLEACKHLNRLVRQIKGLGAKAGVAINPHTPVWMLKDILNEIDVVNIMSVNPGFGSQSFIENTYNKIVDLKKLCKEVESQVLIQVDGGVSRSNSLALAKQGADILVIGNAIFSSQNPIKVIEEFKKLPTKIN